MIPDDLASTLPEEAKFARSLVLKGSLSLEDLQRAVESQGDDLSRGTSTRLAEILIRMGLVSADEMRKVLAEIDERPAREAPVTLGRYRIQGEIGRGAMGVVWKAWDPELARPVALKELLPRGSIGPAEIERFVLEARAAGRLRHPNIVTVYEVGSEAGRYFYAAEFVAGDTLDRLLAEGLPVARALDLVRQVAEALHHAHERGIVHRDVKPGNILVDGEGRARVVDFGLAKDFRGAAGLTLSGAVLGTPRYMSPEQVEGRTNEIGPATDQFSLGVILYEALTRRSPFEGQTLASLAREIVEKDPPPPSRFNPPLPPELDRICLRALRKNPAERYSSLAEFAAELAGAPSMRAAAGRTASRPSRRRPRPRPVRALPVVGLAALAVLVAGGVLVALSGAGPTDEAPPASVPREVERSETLERGLADLEAATLVLYAREGELGEFHSHLASAEESFRLAIEKEPRLSEAHEGLGRTLALRGKREEAETSLRRAAALDPRRRPARFFLGRVLVERAYADRFPAWPEGEATKSWKLAMDEAAAHLDASLPPAGKSADSLATELARAYLDFALSRLDAIDGIRLACRDRFGEERGFEELEWLSGLASQTQDARKERFDAALAIRPRYAMALLSRAFERTTAGDPDGAFRDATEAARIEPGLARAHNVLGNCYRSQGDHARALSEYDEAIRLDPSVASYRVNRSAANIDLGNLETALEDARAALEIDPENAAAYQNRAAALNKMGRYPEAIESLGRGIELDPDGAALYWKRGTLFIQLAEYTRARADFDQAIRLAPNEPDYHAARGLTRHRLGDLEGAIADYKRALELAPPGWQNRLPVERTLAEAILERDRK
ncbi:MAG: tetratricopeptide repeat protein [Planctomycetes bacterium]|nr:tetratricopeptide repeat protein [Planctomycetota bacterium]